MATSSDPPGAALVVHGGAWAIPDAETAAHLDGLRIAVARGRRVLERGGSALDAVEAAVVAMETHPAFDAGRGSVLDRDGAPQLDAGMMCGATLRWGAVAGVRVLDHPIRAARRLLDDADGQAFGARLLVGEGAERYAAEAGLPHVSPEHLTVDRERERFVTLRAEPDYHPSRAIAGPDAPRGTVGAVALDTSGRLAAATSTGGTPYARPGRVGDAPLVGAGVYADAHAALSATGWGEAIAAVHLASRVALRVEAGADPTAAARDGLDAMRAAVVWPGAAAATGGLIVLAADGTPGWAFTTPRMARGGWRAGGEPWVEV